MTTTKLGQDAVDVDKPDSNDLQLWSVTTINGVLDKPALLYWSAEQTANSAIDNQRTWQAMLEEEGRAATVKYLRDARFRQPKVKLSNADLGTAVHKICEQYALTGTKPDHDYITELIRRAGTDDTDVPAEADLAGVMLNQFDGWLQRFTPTYQATEVAVYSPRYGYAGQMDAILTIDGTRLITDYKTSRDATDARGKPREPYADQVGLQLAAYRYAEMAAVWRPRRHEQFRRRYYLLSPAEQALAVPVPEVDHGLCILITPESCEAYPINADEEAHYAFLNTLECFRWVNETSKTVMGQPLQ